MLHYLIFIGFFLGSCKGLTLSAEEQVNSNTAITKEQLEENARNTQLQLKQNAALTFQIQPSIPKLSR
jgi:hypothetical protein